PGVDVVFPVLHGPFGEDGTVQGLLECLDVPYVGAGVLASAQCIHKVVFKDLMAQAGIEQVRYCAIAEAEYKAAAGAMPARISSLGWPVFVKPARLGSSVGIGKVESEAQLARALESAFMHDPVASAEACADGREIECSVIGNDEPIASEPGEILLGAGESGWYDYEAKYSPGGMRLVVPARVPAKVSDRIREVAVKAFV